MHVLRRAARWPAHASCRTLTSSSSATTAPSAFWEAAQTAVKTLQDTAPYYVLTAVLGGVAASVRVLYDVSSLKGTVKEADTDAAIQQSEGRTSATIQQSEGRTSAAIQRLKEDTNAAIQQSEGRTSAAIQQSEARTSAAIQESGARVLAAVESRARDGGRGTSRTHLRCSLARHATHAAAVERWSPSSAVCACHRERVYVPENLPSPPRASII